MELRAAAAGDDGITAGCVLAALGHQECETVAEEARAYVGAMTIARIATELTIIRRALTTPAK